MSSIAEYGFPRQARLLTPKQYQSVFSKSRRISCPEFLFIYAPSDCSRSRLGFAVAKKQVKKAVDRNRLKRLVRESYRKHQSKLPDIDLVFMVRKSILELDNKTIHLKLEETWHRLINRLES